MYFRNLRETVKVLKNYCFFTHLEKGSIVLPFLLSLWNMYGYILKSDLFIEGISTIYICKTNLLKELHKLVSFYPSNKRK